MKRFIIISLLAAMVLPSFPCAGGGTDNYYLFCVCDKQEFSQRAFNLTNKNWQAYLGDTNDYFWFNADEIIKAAQKKGDQLMVSYIQNLKLYLDCADEVASEQWNYPTKEQLAKRKQTLLKVQSYAFSKIRTKLRSQHALLYMRCNMLLGNHQANVTFWEQTASQYIETVYKDMMQNIYAGALLKTGHADEAGRLFAEMGDWNSLMTQYYKSRSFAAIRQEYLRDANSAVLPFLLQDFVNNAQEAIDAEKELSEGKLFIRKIVRSEAEQMIAFAGQVVGEGKTRVPALWKTAQAWLEYLYGHKQEAHTHINTATALDGTERMKDNARIIQLYINSAQQSVNAQFDAWLAGELKWLKNHTTTDYEYGNYYDNAMHRLVHQVLGQKYEDAGQPLTSLAIYKAVGSYRYEMIIDTMKVENLQKYVYYCQKPASTPLEEVLKPLQDMKLDEMNDLVGTKYMRLCQWDKAMQWLSKVPLKFYNDKRYACYAANRRYTIEPWIRRQWLKSGIEWSDIKWQLQQHPKVTFCREIQQMEGELNVLSGQQQQQRCYDLAVRYAQAHFTGDCWFLMRDGKSIYDELRANETDLAEKAMNYLRQACQTSDFKLKEKALFAMSYYYLHKNPWYTTEWDSSKMDDVMKINTASSQYEALKELARFEQANSQRTSSYVSRCDNYKTFLASRK
jgi:hypothetical protein